MTKKTSALPPKIREFPISVDGKPYHLRLGTNALCRLEDVLDKGVGAEVFLLNLVAASSAGKLRMADVRRVVWAAFADHHPEITEEQAGRLIDEAGGPEVIAAPLAHAIEDALLVLLGGKEN